VKGRLRSHYRRLVRRFGGDKNPGAKKKAITAISHALLKIVYQVLKTGTPYQDPGADFYTRRESAARRQAWLERRLQQLYPGRTVIVTIGPPPGSPPHGSPPGAPAQAALSAHHCRAVHYPHHRSRRTHPGTAPYKPSTQISCQATGGEPGDEPSNRRCYPRTI
jgi:hypothetical protein